MAYESLRRRDQIHERRTNLSAGANPLIIIGGNNGTESRTRTFELPFLRFGLYSDIAIDITIETSIDDVTFRTFTTAAGVAATFFSVYNLAAPLNADGVLVIPFPFTRIRLTNNTAGASTTLEFTATFSNYR